MEGEGEMHLVAIRVSCLRHQSTLIIGHSGEDRDEDVAGLSTSAGMQIKGHGDISSLGEEVAFSWVRYGNATSELQLQQVEFTSCVST